MTTAAVTPARSAINQTTENTERAPKEIRPVRSVAGLVAREARDFTSLERAAWSAFCTLSVFSVVPKLQRHRATTPQSSS
jgi:hypothetical protein